MQTQAAEQSMSTSRQTPVRKPFLILALLLLVGLGIYAFNAGYFNDTRGKATDLLDTASTTVGDWMDKLNSGNSTVPPAVTRNTSPLDGVARPEPTTETTVELANDTARPTMAATPRANDALDLARNAFAAGDINAAIEAYRALLANNPNDIAALGEMGNVLYAVGMKPAAAQAFFEVANRALDQGQFEFAANLLPAVGEGNPMLATQLNNRLSDAYARSNMGMPDQQVPAMYQPYQPPMPPFMQRGEW